MEKVTTNCQDSISRLLGSEQSLDGRFWREEKCKTEKCVQAGVKREMCRIRPSTTFLGEGCVTDKNLDCSVMDWQMGWAIWLPFFPTLLRCPCCSTQQRESLDVTTPLRFLKHENCYFKSLNGFLSLRLKFAFIMVTVSFFRKENYF